jgi:hypothetical protein
MLFLHSFVSGCEYYSLDSIEGCWQHCVGVLHLMRLGCARELPNRLYTLLLTVCSVVTWFLYNVHIWMLWLQHKQRWGFAADRAVSCCVSFMHTHCDEGA